MHFTGIPSDPVPWDLSEPEPAAAAVDIIQIPAFLSRQTDLLLAAGETGVMVTSV